MFRGASPLSIDDKGRMAIPARYRQRLQDLCAGQLIMTINLEQERYLPIYPLPAWEKVEQELDNIPDARRARHLKRLLIGHAEESEMDAQGRILVPMSLRETAGLVKKVILIGQRNKFELWNEQTWYQLRDKWLQEESMSDADLVTGLESLSFRS